MSCLTKPSGILFLDVDGVLNNLDSLCAADGIPSVLQGAPLRESHYFKALSAPCVARLADITRTCPGLMIVLTSTWRLFPTTMEALTARLGDEGVEIAGRTEDLHPRDRADEIAQWLSDHPEFCDLPYVILDDERHGIEGGMADRLVLTNEHLGLTDHETARVILLLKGIKS